MVVGTAVMGKPADAGQGDSLDGFDADLTPAAARRASVDPLADPHAILQARHHAAGLRPVRLPAHARSSRSRSRPSSTRWRARPTTPISQPGEQTKIQHSFSYSDGFGREIQKKIQAEPGPLVEGGPDVSPRWVGSGWTIFNNKGKPVRQYEPFFSATHRFEFGVQVGVSPVLFYDPVERVVATLHPNHTWEKVVFDPWQQDDLGCQRHRARSPIPTDRPGRRRLLPAPARRRLPADLARAARMAARWARRSRPPPTRPPSTPTRRPSPTSTRSGRTFLTVAHNRFKRSDTPPADPPTRTFHTPASSSTSKATSARSIDAHGPHRHALRLRHARQPHPPGQHGGRRALDAERRGRQAASAPGTAAATSFRTDLRRAAAADASSYLQRRRAAPELLVGAHRVRREPARTPKRNNLRGKPYQLFDQRRRRHQRRRTTSRATCCAAAASSPATTRPRRTGRPPCALDDRSLHAAAPRYDALNRPIALTTPDDSSYPPDLQRGQPARDGRREPARRDGDGQPCGRRSSPTSTTTPRASASASTTATASATTYDYDPLTFRLDRDLHDACRGSRARRAEPALHLRPGRQHHPHPRRRAADDLLPQPARRAERRLHLRRPLPADRGHRPRAPGPGRRPADPPTAPDAFNAFHVGLDHPGDGNAMGTLHRALRLRRRRQLPRDAASRQRPGASRLDARLRLRRSQPDRSRRTDEQPAEPHARSANGAESSPTPTTPTAT